MFRGRRCQARSRPLDSLLQELYPRCVPAALQRCALFNVNHELTQALSLARRVYAGNPQEHHCLVLISDSLVDLGRYAEAEKALDELEARTDDIHLQSRRARL